MAPARRTARPAFWPERGRDARALWGTCEGADTYETWVDREGPGYRCSCPSRKKPCRHALALMLMAAETPDAIPEAPAPEPLQAWLKRRDARRGGQSQRDEAAAVRRERQRVEKVEEGLAALRIWLGDRVRLGLAGLEAQPHGFWTEIAGRLEDAQVKALPERLLRLEERVGAHPAWPRELLDELGLLALLVEAFGERERLPEPMQAELRTRVGWPQREKEVLASGEAVQDLWEVLGQRHEDMRWTSGLQATYTWVRGRETRRWALLLRFVHASQRGRPGQPALPAPGEGFEGELVFAPSAWPQRAFPRDPPEPSPLAHAPEPDCEDLEALLARWARALAASPWTERICGLVAGLTPAEEEGRWWLVDRRGDALPLRGAPPWTLLALSGGHPVDLCVEWDGAALRPLSARGPARTLALEAR
ncbi:MAG: SWIM zinc finger family protein [Alphaproteobacteria bacterium]|nr:SWIM zinc finger family protein [Alphaproteobacteria bacterium]MCB9797512.1 SWIM zinc finger family protein [Alphaproteobacteria bacterium]